jgi:gas vesicle protein
VGGFLLGVGVGAGLGILLAPAAGSETREAIRDKAVDMKNRVVDSAATATGKVRSSSVRNMPSTGTEG